MKGVVSVLAVSAAALAAVVTGASGASPVSAVKPTERVAGKTYAQWLTADWQWLMANGRLITTEPKESLQCLAQGQHGSVWFLQDAYEGPMPVTVTCSIPAGRYILLEGPGFECSTIEHAPFHATRAKLPACAASFKLKGVDVSVDGTPPVPSSYQVATPVFRFSIPARGGILKTTGHTRGYGAVHSDAL